MSLTSETIPAVPADTTRVARAAFPPGNPSLTLRDTLGRIFADADVAALFPACGQPGLPPWRLALVTILPFRENLADRQAAEAVRARIDWQYLLGLELTDPGFDCSVRSECRDRLLAGSAEDLWLENLLEQCRGLGLLKARGQQRTDSTHVVAAIRVLSRLELVGETLRAALNELATVAPNWLQELAPVAWYERDGKRIEDARLPRTKAAREAYAQTVGEDGFRVLDAVDAPDAPEAVRKRPSMATLRRTWQRHYERTEPPLECPRIVSTDLNDLSCKIRVKPARGREKMPGCPRPAHLTSWREEELMTESRPIFPSGSLNAELDAFKAACAGDWPPEAFALVNQTLADLAQTGIQETVLKVGDVAPSFTLPDQEGRLVHSQALLAKGPLVLVFYRGMW